MENINTYISEKLIINKSSKVKDTPKYLSNLFKENGFDNTRWAIDADYKRHWFKKELEELEQNNIKATNFYICTYSLGFDGLRKLEDVLDNFKKDNIIISYRVANYNPTYIYICYK